MELSSFPVSSDGKIEIMDESKSMIYCNVNSQDKLAEIDLETGKTLMASLSLGMPILDYSIMESDPRVVVALTNREIAVMDSRQGFRIVNSRYYKTNYHFRKVKAFSHSAMVVGSSNNDLRLYKRIHDSCRAKTVIRMGQTYGTSSILSFHRSLDKTLMMVGT